MTQPKRILVIPLRFIGDAVLTIPVIRALRARYPESQINCLLPPHLVKLFETCPYVSNIVVEPKSKYQLWQILHHNNYDTAILLRRSITQAALLKLAGIKTVVGFDEQRYFEPIGFKRWGLFLSKKARFPELKTQIPQINTYLSLLHPLSIESPDPKLELWPTEEEKVLAKEKLHAIGQKIVVVHCCSASREKGIAMEKWVSSLQYLVQQGYTLVSMGTSADRNYYNELSDLSGVHIANFCGETNLRLSAAILGMSQLIFGLDSGPMHMAAAMGTPNIITIYGPTNEKQWAPYPYSGKFTPIFNQNLTCRPCLPKVCSHNNCREQLSASDILAGLKRHIEQTQ